MTLKRFPPLPISFTQVADEGAGLYTSELRGNDEAGEGTARVPFKTVLR